MMPDQIEQIAIEQLDAGYRAAMEAAKARFIEACERKEEWQAVLDWLDARIKEVA